MASYTITIKRTEKEKGTLVYSGNMAHSCTCWWDSSDEIPAGTYVNCSKTYLNSKQNSTGGKREGIFIPNVKHRVGIFVHYWPGPPANLKVWSDGCTVVKEVDMLKIWNDIAEMDAQNITVTVVDK